ncbi:DUF6489 family protein [Roseomonas sp. NAR14]|uniref:DUF6489 family protein n=1 Tax=Roseomonas acroporae TaxID=2937791 RepID=A0A9X1YCB6_9PROT|nr:DUF6489 family protein [Roseomonas acroporae]
MKVRIEIDCSADEARQFFGLPDVKPMQEAVMNRLQDRMMDAISADTPEALMRAWFPFMPQTPEALQKAMTSFLKSPFGKPSEDR